MTVRVYRSTDASAPTLNGTAGTLIAVLDACLVNGYGAKASSGWIKSHTGTNLAVYQMPSGTLKYLRIADTGASGAGVARARGFATITDITAETGTGMFPTDAQQSGGGIIHKSNLSPSASAAMAWVVIATQTMFYMWCNPTNSTLIIASSYVSMFSFGDIISYVSGDAYHTHLCSQTSTTVSSAANTFGALNSSNNWAASAGNYIARNYAQAVASVSQPIMKLTDTVKSNNVTQAGAVTSSVQPLPEVINQTMLFAPIWVGEPSQVIRGVLPGVWIMLNLNAFDMINSVEGASIAITTGALAGKTLEMFTTGNGGRIWMETSNTW